jgi:hypothetical protein
MGSDTSRDGPIDRAQLLLSAQRGLLGVAGPGLLGACIALRESSTVILTFFVRPDIADDEREELDSDTATQVIADCPAGVRLDVRFVEVDLESPAYVRGQGDWFFLRRELGARASVLQPEE